MAFKGPAKPTEITYGELTEGEVIRDRNGNDWRALGVESGDEVTFWLAEIVGNVRKHRLTKPATDAVTVMRSPERAEAIADAEKAIDEGPAGPPEKEATPEEAVATVEEVLDGEVIAEETADHEEARDLARAGGDPMSLPPFEEFTDPEMRSHLYLVHGVYAHDVKTRKALVKMHDDLHADEKGQHTPHNHEGAFPA